MSNKRKYEEGFTLLEVMVAFVVLSGVLGIIYQMISTGTAQSKRSENETGALLIAKSKLSEAINQMGLTEGNIDGYVWHLDVNPATTLSDSDYPAKLINVTVNVSWIERQRDRSVELATQKLLWDIK